MSTASARVRPRAGEMLTVVQAADILGIGRTKAYAMIRSDEWPTPIVRFGRLIRIPAAPLSVLVKTGSAPHPDAA